jgi:hypothetical protein
MTTLLSKSLAACGFALAAASLLTMPAAVAADDKKPAKAVKAKAKAEPKARAHPKADDASIPDGPDADITDTVTSDYNCELGNKLTIFANDKDDSHIALRWKKRIHRLDRIGTTTGAQRFENKTFGLIWIGIPAKGMLLDSKLNRQLANECKNADQERAASAPKVEKQAEMPSSQVKVKVEQIVPAQALPAMTPAITPVPAAMPAADPAAPKAAPI